MTGTTRSTDVTGGYVSSEAIPLTESGREEILPRTSPVSNLSSASEKAGVAWSLKDRFRRRGKQRIGVGESIKAIVLSSWLNIFVLLVPLSWVAHFMSKKAQHSDESESWPFSVVFSLSLLALVPLQRLLEFGGEQMSLYCGKDLGDLIVVTLSNTIEATLAIILFSRCELRLLQSTLVGVILLHLLLVPGVAFIVGGTKLIYQELNPHSAQLNHTLLTMGVLTLMLPITLFSTFFANTDTPQSESNSSSVNKYTVQQKILMVSRGLAVLLHYVYILSRIFLHNPPGDDNSFRALPDAPAAFLEQEEKLLQEEPEVNPWVCAIFLLVTIGIMTPTTEWLVDSVEIVREEGYIPEEWFGLILLPLASYSSDALLAIGYFLRSTIQHFRGKPAPPLPLAKARSIDLSIQFNLFWIPFIVSLGWWNNKPMSLLFDPFEVSILIGAILLVNYVTADSKTNWAEGATMVSFYVMIALTAWFYESDSAVAQLLHGGTCLDGDE